MLPVTDFNFVVCGFATLAATVGYACARKARPLPSRALPQLLSRANSISDSAPDSSSKMVLEKSMEEPDSNLASEPASEPTSEPSGIETTVVCANSSLKRKRTREQDEIDETDPDMGYPHNLKSIYPNKRRSGSVSDEEPTKGVVGISLGLAQTEMVPEPCDAPSNEEPYPVTRTDSPEPVSPEPKPDVVEPTSNPEPPKSEPVVTDVPRFAFPKTPPRVTQFPFTRSTMSPAFANFAGSSSPFFSMSPSNDGTSVASKPIWASTATVAAEGTGSDAGESEEKAVSPPALIAVKTPTAAIQPHSTGEEEEDIALELKGVKLYVKRGEDNFSGGMIGHIKLLSHKTTLSKRLLFRREPLWKVSMNVRMQPTVRCTYDAQENILRVALKELPDKWESECTTPQTVIYAFKPSRSCRRSDFQDFAEALLAQARQGGQS
ncbi:hypothetical protein B0H19DRAFT_494867 [Mycena capillaripes]|nr:hypothetical protein B0H19DRAFT_494867 [Mycena capillaripes]